MVIDIRKLLTYLTNERTNERALSQSQSHPHSLNSPSLSLRHRASGDPASVRGAPPLHCATTTLSFSLPDSASVSLCSSSPLHCAPPLHCSSSPPSASSPRLLHISSRSSLLPIFLF
ncbi:hypothetical protein RchiOBHm_Chr7g0229201 [Rosa chinensis]|uniref:Uncharacterized protein n=1 Tax=Rosa chinensis TaxID=74649 RepID=A0A2P6PF39_ROSCH|nr:hypothetical protein RchiOBHm_Chr7g0229201 [Rosa chinensis]